jgi:hypothetical protein
VFAYPTPGSAVFAGNLFVLTLLSYVCGAVGGA